MAEFRHPDSGPLVDADGLSVRSVAPAAHLLLHCAPADGPALAARAGLDLPGPMLRAASRDGWHALHLAPDEWLLVGAVEAAAGLQERFASAGQTIAHSLVDVTDRSLGLDISGKLATDLLSAGCPLDLDSRTFPTRACTRTLFGKAMVMLWRTDDRPTFRLEFARSFGGYVGALLTVAAGDLTELGLD